MKKLLITGFALANVAAMAALSPYNQRAKELGAVVSDAAVEKAVGAARRGTGVVDGIVHAGKISGKDGHNYLIRSGVCRMTVAVEYIAAKPGVVGAQEFKVVSPSKMNCRPRIVGAANGAVKGALKGAVEGATVDESDAEADIEVGEGEVEVDVDTKE